MHFYFVWYLLFCKHFLVLLSYHTYDMVLCGIIETLQKQRQLPLSFDFERQLGMSLVVHGGYLPSAYEALVS